jgi:hypothetical protein
VLSRVEHLVFTTTFDGKLRAYSIEDGSEV